MKYISVCSGIEAATVAWHHMGWTPAWFSEIEKFPSAVLAHHYPNVPNRGDMTKFNEWPDEAIDLLVGGTPCQSFSVAGLRRGLADPRGNLMLTFLAIAGRYRPRWIVWENVPGVLSSGQGRDFGTFLRALGQLGYGWAYRVLDAQYFGVAQRRRRVFVVGYLGDWRRAAAVLFERESVSRYPAPSREKRKETAKCITAGVGKRFDFETETLPVVAGTLQACDAKEVSNQWVDEGKAVITFHNRQDPVSSEGVTNALGAKDNGLGICCVTTQFGDIAGSLTARHDSSPCADRGQNVVAQTVVDLVQTPQAAHSHAVAFDWKMGAKARSIGLSEEQSPTLGTSADRYAVAFEPGSIARRAGPAGESNIAPTLRRQMGDNQPAVRISMQVRRLTPRECERLQGFPDDYTDIKPKGKDTPDGPRYKALGNSMAVPVMRWIGERINAQENA